MIIRKAYNSLGQYYKDLHDMQSKGYRLKNIDVMLKNLIIVRYFK